MVPACRLLDNDKRWLSMRSAGKQSLCQYELLEAHRRLTARRVTAHNSNYATADCDRAGVFRS
jgi:hypothetical protein